MSDRLYREDELEAVNCPECGSGNVLEAPDTCESCREWRKHLTRKQKGSMVPNHAGFQNLDHVLRGKCDDRDCELHYPFTIEDEAHRLTAMAWFIAGGERMVEVMQEQLDNVFGDRDARLDFLRFDYDQEDTLP